MKEQAKASVPPPKTIRAGDREKFDVRRLSAMSRKEVLQVSRDPSTYIIVFALPLILLLLFGYGLSLDTGTTRIGLVVQDDSEAGQSLAAAYHNNDWFEVEQARSMAEIEDDLVSGDIFAMVVIPQGFGEGVLRGNAPPIQIVTDGSQPNNATFAAGYAEGLRANWAAGRGLEARQADRGGIRIKERYWFNPELKSRYSLVIGSIAIVMVIIGTLQTSLVIAREWERGTMEAMMATPMLMSEFLISKIIPYFVLSLISIALCTVLAVTVFGVPFRGSILALFVISCAFLLPALGLGLLISAVAKNQFVASQAGLLSGFLPTLLLSGFLYEISSMPLPIQAITYIIPARYLVPSLQTVFMAGDVWSLFLPNIAALVSFGVLLLFLTFRVNRRSLV